MRPENIPCSSRNVSAMRNGLWWLRSTVPDPTPIQDVAKVTHAVMTSGEEPAATPPAA